MAVPVSAKNAKQAVEQKPQIGAALSRQNGVAHPILNLQRTIGNQRMQHFLTGWSNARMVVQAKRAIGETGNRFEREADRLADQVVGGPQALPTAPCSCGGACASCRAKEPARDTIPKRVHDVVRSPGQPIEPATRAFMEARLGQDFSGVRIHTGERAAESARSIGAYAFTVGQHIAFDHGQYSPGSLAGRHLLAHELIHVAQQAMASADSVPLVQRRPRRDQAGSREATVAVRWTEDQDRFYERLLAALTNSEAFRGIGRSNFEHSTGGEPGLRAYSDSFHTAYAQRHSDRKAGQAVNVHFSANYDPDHDYHGSDLTGKKISFVAEIDTSASAQQPARTAAAPAAPGRGPKPNETAKERIERQSEETVRVMAARFVDAGRRGNTCAKWRIRFDGKELYPDYELNPRELEVCARTSGSAASFPVTNEKAVAAAKNVVDDLVSAGPGTIEATFSFTGGLKLQKWEITPAPPQTKASSTIVNFSGDCSESDSNYGECLARQRTAAYQSGIRAAGELATAYYDPLGITDDDSHASGVPLVPKVPGGTKIIRYLWSTLKARGETAPARFSIKVPKVLEFRTAASTLEKLDPEILATVLNYRASANGSTAAAFNRNFAAVRIRLAKGEVKYIKSLNVASATHSEEEILAVIGEIKKEGANVKVEQIFSERVPCKNCWHEIVKRHFGQDVDIFYFIGYVEDRPAALRKLYY